MPAKEIYDRRKRLKQERVMREEESAAVHREREDEGESAWPECCVCGDLVDPREVEEGGGPDGCQLTDGTWVCSHECWCRAVGEEPESP